VFSALLEETESGYGYIFYYTSTKWLGGGYVLHVLCDFLKIKIFMERKKQNN
jgi:hypothetical protein